MADESVRISEADGGRGTRQGALLYLDRALWRTLAASTSTDELRRSWLTLQCRMIDGARAGVLVNGNEHEGALKPCAYWPEEAAVDPRLAEAAEVALSRRQGVVVKSDPDAEGAPVAIAYPLMVDQALSAVCAVWLEGRSDADLQTALRQLQWGAAWLEAIARREQAREQTATIDRLGLVLDCVAESIERESFRGASTALCTELASRLDAERVSFGLVAGGAVRVAAVSHSAQFDRRMNLLRAVQQAMQEAIDQRLMLRIPAGECDVPAVRLRHESLTRLAESGCTACITVPVQDGNAMVGAITAEFVRRDACDDNTAEVIEAVAALAGPVLRRAREEERLLPVKALKSLERETGRIFGPRHLGRKAFIAASLALVLFFAFYRTEFNVSADAVLEGAVQRIVAAPLDGYVNAAFARPGDTVAEGTPLAMLDDHELKLELHAWKSRRGQVQRENERAVAEHDRAKVLITRAQLDETDAQIELLQSNIDRLTVAAPFDALVIEGDLSQSLGRAVRKGETLFKLAPLAAYRVVVKVDERDISEVVSGATGTMVLAALPAERFDLAVDRLTPITQAEDGRNTFRVEATLEGEHQRLRPGMEGVAKIRAGERLLIWVWTRRLVQWVRLTLWRWTP